MLVVTAFGSSGGAADADVVASLARLARQIELVVVCDQNDAVGLVRRLQAGLPRHAVVTLLVTLDDDGAASAELALIQTLLQDGALPVAVGPTGMNPPARDAAIRRLAEVLGADDVLAASPIGVRTPPDPAYVRSTDPTS